jgi:N-methylhydantoinase B
VNGGLPAALNRFVWQSGGGEAAPPHASKVTDVRIASGGRVRLETPGGGGFGPPTERAPDKVARDVRLGYVSREAARTLYKVVVTEAGEVDAAATAALRRGMAA